MAIEIRQGSDLSTEELASLLWVELDQPKLGVVERALYLTECVKDVSCESKIDPSGK